MRCLSVVVAATFALSAAGCAASDASPDGTAIARPSAAVESPPTTRNQSPESTRATSLPQPSSVIEDGGSLPTPDCLARFDDAAAVDEMQDATEDLYPALEQCSGLEDWIAASGAVPDALDGVDPTEFAYNACSYGGPTESATCIEAIAADPLGLGG